jgi:hypothetical protein
MVEILYEGIYLLNTREFVNKPLPPVFRKNGKNGKKLSNTICKKIIIPFFGSVQRLSKLFAHIKRTSGLLAASFEMAFNYDNSYMGYKYHPLARPESLTPPHIIANNAALSDIVEALANVKKTLPRVCGLRTLVEETITTCTDLWKQTMTLLMVGIGVMPPPFRKPEQIPIVPQPPTDTLTEKGKAVADALHAAIVVITTTLNTQISADDTIRVYTDKSPSLPAQLNKLQQYLQDIHLFANDWKWDL